MNSSDKMPTPGCSLPLPIPAATPPTTTGEKAAPDAFRQLIARYRRAAYEGLEAEFEGRFRR